MYTYYYVTVAVDRLRTIDNTKHAGKRRKKCRAMPITHRECPRCRRKRLLAARRGLLRYWHTRDEAGLNAPIRIIN